MVMEKKSHAEILRSRFVTVEKEKSNGISIHDVSPSLSAPDSQSDPVPRARSPESKAIHIRRRSRNLWLDWVKRAPGGVHGAATDVRRRAEGGGQARAMRIVYSLAAWEIYCE